MFIIKRLTEQVIDFEHTAGIAGNQYRMVIITELVRFFVFWALMQKSISQIAFHAEDEFKTGLFSRQLFACPVKDVTVVTGTDGGHAVFHCKVYVILIFGTAVKDGAFVIVQMVTEIVLLYFSSPPS